MPGDYPQELIVACYTPGDYAKEANERLIPSVETLGLPHEIREYSNRGGWLRNVFGRVECLARLDKQFPKADFLSVDVDGVVHSDPWPFLRTLRCDFAVYYLDDIELICSTMFMPAGPKRRQLLANWIARNKQHPNVSLSQVNLQFVVEQDRRLRVAKLPPEYCCIFDMQRWRTPDIVPVIEQFQASRRFRKWNSHKRRRR